MERSLSNMNQDLSESDALFAKEVAMNLTAELDKTIKMFESEIPANPGSAKNERLESKMERSIAEYFRDLENAIDWDALDQIYYRNVKQE